MTAPKQNFDIVIGGNTETDTFNLCFCPIHPAMTAVIELANLTRADMKEIKSAVTCALMTGPKKRRKKR